ncbi:hypothetical protein SAMN04487820_11020 [Actinopolyspora mzabensis]|uniref:Uncharacterized protein n=1 Tax=Actinopolyspora mzabensis TaxID=995066 RepID=A0A1G9DDK6_ACTMZ|nr:hypothetical protein [Actinopolyspora mzabensis]SDK61887.1 hypothetical protein SAMN04487820_11020 [Actinopolyspora mzabensis]
MNDSGESDLGFTSTLRAEELRFHEKPSVGVRFHGTSEHESASERTNFPEPVEPRTTYRDVRIDYRLTATAQDPHEENQGESRTRRSDEERS